MFFKPQPHALTLAAAGLAAASGINLDISLDLSIGGGQGHDAHNDAHNTTINHPAFPSSGTGLPYTILAQLPDNSTLLENIAVRPNGDLLVTQNQPEATVFLIREPWSLGFADLEAVHTFPASDADGVLGIAEVSDDSYVVATIRWADPATPAPHSAALRHLRLGGDDGMTIMDDGFVGEYPGAGFLNGLTVAGDGPSVLVADSMPGVVRKMDLNKKKQEVALDLPGMKVHDKEAVMPLGINGVRTFGEYLYWTNSNTRQIFRACMEGAQTQELVADLSGDAESLDDFTFDKRGNIWVLTNVDNKLMVVRPDGSSEVVLGSEGDMAVAGATSAVFGKTVWDEHILYVTTTGATQFPVNGTIVEPGKVVAVDTRSFS